MHEPLRQTRLPQQSLLLTQLPPELAQHDPALEQLMLPQHWELLEQNPRTPTQAPHDPESRQTDPLQQSSVTEQVSPEARHWPHVPP